MACDMEYLHWVCGALYGVIVIGVMVRILMDNRQPAKTMAWILALLFLPFVGLALYVFFGQNRRKERYISQTSLDQLTKRSMTEFLEQEDLTMPLSYRSLIYFFYNQNMALPFKDNEAEIYTSGYEFFPALLREIAKARHHIHVGMYIFNDDELGNLVADALIDKAGEGVEVRVIYDDVGCWRVKNSFFERMRDGGVDVHAFMPVKFPLLTSKVNYRNHRKLIVIDGSVGFVGGYNIATRYVKGLEDMPWRDTHLMVRGGAVYGIQRAFLVDWYFVDRTLITNHDYYPEQNPMIRNGCLAQVVTSSPVSPWRDIMQGYIRILYEARRYVYMESPYFLPSEPVMFAMRTAALTGVDVRLMLPRRSDARIVEWASVSYVMETLEAGVKVYLYADGFNHSKLLVSDDLVSTCGSANVDFRSFEHNFESNIFFYDRGMALRMKRVFLNDQKHCQLIEEVCEVESRSFLTRLCESALRVVSPLM